MDLSWAALSFSSYSTQPLCLLLLGFLVAALAVAYFGLFGTFVFFFQKIPPLASGRAPGVTVIKPCFDNKDNEAENLDCFFNQDYPGPVEILFTITSPKDPIVPVLKQYLARYPEADAKIVHSTTRIAYWNKVNSVRDAQEQAKHEVIVWSDSDVVVRPNYLSQMVAALQQPGVSVVTTPQYDFRANNFPTALKVLANNCDDATFMMAYNLVTKMKKVALGHSIGFWAAEFNSFKKEAWETLSFFFADDLALPHVFAKHGKRVVFRNIYCPVQYSDKTLRQVMDQKRRWIMCQKHAVGNRFVHLMGALFYPEVPAALLVLLTGASELSLWLFALACVTRIGISAVFEALFLGSLRMSVRYFWTVPIWDLLQLPLIIEGFFKNTIILGGRKFVLDKKYYLKPLET